MNNTKVKCILSLTTQNLMQAYFNKKKNKHKIKYVRKNLLQKNYNNKG